MRTIIILILTFAGIIASAQTGVKTSTFIVKGNCEECKVRIENAADIKGVKISKWDPDTKVATVTYDTAKVKLEKIQEAIASRGYDAGDYKGNDKAYSRLPKCCKYRDGKCEEPSR
jgi:periplasmic mercuric ion binding protein